MDTLLIAIARNAAALLNDAEFLFEHGRYARAAALAVLAGEEAGKFWLVKFDPAWQQKFHLHPAKLSTTARFQLAEATGVISKSTRDLRDTYNAVPDHPEYTAWVKRAQAFASKKEAGLYVDFDDKDEPTAVAGQETATECLAYDRAEVERLGIAEVVKRGRAKT